MAAIGLKKYVIKFKNKLIKDEPITTIIDKINWEKTRAFAFCVGSGQYYPIYILDEEVKDHLKGDLLNIVDPKTGQNVVKKILDKEELFSSRKVDNFPDLIVMLNEGYYTSSDVKPVTFYDSESFDHHIEGIIMGIGPDFKRGCDIGTHEIVDVAPTILHMLNYPVARDMDGKVIKELFGKDSGLSKRDTKHKKYKLDAIEEKGRDASIDDETKIKERLKSLGYLK